MKEYTEITIKEYLNNWLQEYLKEDDIKSDFSGSSFYSIGLDSLSMVELITDIEDKFELDINIDNFDQSAWNFDNFVKQINRISK